MNIIYYYSLTNNTYEVAKKYQSLGFELREIKSKHKYPKKFFFRILSGGFRAGLNLKDKIEDINLHVSKSDNIIIAGPIWNGKFSSPINTILKKLDINNLNVTFVFTSGSGSAPKVVKKIWKKYPHKNIIVLKEPLKYPEELNKLVIC